MLRDVITPRQTRRFPDWASGSIPRHGGLAAFAGVWWSVASGLRRGLCPAWGKPTTDLSAPGPWCCRAGGGGRVEDLGRQGGRFSAGALQLPLA